MSALSQAATKELDGSTSTRLREFVRLRASQLDGCAYCIDMHTKDARAVGEAEKCPDGLERKRHACSFDNLERVLAA
jgi:AhpD family alkylhydroperoxidase